MIPVCRPYQDRAVCAVRQHVLDGILRNLLVLPTGTGKTVVACAIIHSSRRNFGGKILFVAHRIELIDQCVRQLAKWDVTEVGVIRADDPRRNELMPIQIASIQTLARRSCPFVPDIIIIDEAHRSCAESYRKLLAQFPEAIVIGLTATPCRQDGQPLGEIYGALEVAATYAESIADGFIVKPICYGAERGADLSKVHTVAGDYNLGELEAAMLDGALVAGIVQAWKLHAGGRRTVVFASGVAHSKALVAEFVAAGVRAAHVDGDTPADVRESVGEALRMGDLEVVSNFGVYVEGWDEPCVKCAVLARPTKSLTLYRQMVGRILRPFEGQTPLILDHAFSIDRHGLPTDDYEWCIDGPAKRISNAKFRTCPECYAYLEGSPAKCPQCGNALSMPKPYEPKPEIATPLVIKIAGPDERRKFYDEQVEISKRRGFKPGFGAFKFKEKFGSWPPWAWSQATKAAFAQDPIWQASVKKQEERREYWKSRQKQDVTPEQSEADVERAVEESFADYVAR